MGNCHCRPREGGESLREFLSRKFHKLSGKRKIDDLVTMAINDERQKLEVKKGAEGTFNAGEVEDHHVEMELEDLEYDTVFDDEFCPYSDVRTSSKQEPLTNSQTSDDLNEKTEQECDGKPSRQEVTEYKEDNDYIRVLQQQLKQVQNELANLQRGTSSRGQSKFTDREDQGGSCSANSFQSQQPVEIEESNIEPMSNVESPTETLSYTTPRVTFLHAQGDTRSSPEKQLKDKLLDNVSAAGERAAVNERMEDDNKGETKDKDDRILVTRKDGRRSKMNGMITEGLRTKTNGKLSKYKAQVAAKQTLQKTKIANDKYTVEDKTEIASKIAALQKRDPTLPGPDKGIVWPKTMENLSKDDKAYYVEQFLRSELFRQRCLRKYQGSKTWMNGLSPFHLWVLENEGTDELKTVLRPLPKRQNNAQAKVRCWRGNTPPPRPKSP